MSGHVEPQDASASMTFNEIVAYIPKPWDDVQLVALLRAGIPAKS